MNSRDEGSHSPNGEGEDEEYAVMFFQGEEAVCGVCTVQGPSSGKRDSPSSSSSPATPPQQQPARKKRRGTEKSGSNGQTDEMEEVGTESSAVQQGAGFLFPQTVIVTTKVVFRCGHPNCEKDFTTQTDLSRHAR